MSKDKPYRVVVIGLGSMGMGAARSCIAAGLETCGIDVRQEALDELKEAGAVSVGRNGLAFASSLDAVLLLPVNADQCRQALFGPDGIAPHLRPGTPVMVSATVAADDARDLEARLKEQNLPMLDAPVSGGSVRAAKGEITVMAAGAPETFDKLGPLLDAISAKVFRIGTEIGQGSTVKIIHQLLAGVHIAVAAEAMALASRAGIPLQTLYNVVTNAAGNSWMFENRMQHVLDGDYTPHSSVDIFVKDLGLVVETGNALKFPIPIAAIAHSLFVNASNAGYGKRDDSAVIRNYSGIKLPGDPA
ncbi:MAG: NAD(P)-dependent oxidoreductase [Castellaniella sp.]|uniref:L-threonate dehydrogenase n=1 Tax=Castellaniella sp. TaxID=1955812 RepID=UPI0011FE372E|nr:L-threonate dehydrogenase [Castellaniella sp.]TAN26671.1 MAG: NAD(P)-dependent oxidoreductase [Castellaniella sp.]